MARRHEQSSAVNATDGRQMASSRKDAAVRTHLMVFLVTSLFLLTINLLTGPDELWFYWPVFFWGWAVVIQAAATYGTDAPARVLGVLRSIVPGAAATDHSSPKAHGATDEYVETVATVAIESVEQRVQRLWRIARQIPVAAVREQAFRICAAADRIAEVMVADRTDARTVAWFGERLLAPTESLLAGYLRLAGRGIAGADATLRRIEEQNLPQIESRLDTLYQQLHRGDVIDLAVASEMLELELDDAPPSLRSST
jgi:hypothetical protein